MSTVRTGALVLTSVLASAFVRYLLNPIFHRRVAFITYFPALVFSAWIGGWSGGLAALALSTIAAMFYFASPFQAIPVARHADAVTSVVFVIVGLSVSAISSAQRKSRQDAVLAAEALRIRIAQEETINQVGQAVRGSLDPDEIECAVAETLGKALGADRCFYATFDLSKHTLSIQWDWHAEGLPAVAGHYDISDLEWMQDELFLNGTAVHADIAPIAVTDTAKALKEKFRHRSFIAVPLFGKGVVVAALIVSMTEPRTWTPAEVTVVEQSATFTRTALEKARVSHREHTIAQQLQAALQPAVPTQMPGLRLTEHYRPALEEAAVGGDFSDVFSPGGDITFLVVGDVSGKGLAAASQVSVLRNMLRYALYTGANLAEPVQRLNETLCGQNLLIGFATLFVGRYESKGRIFSYVNCGQEPALIRRRQGGKIEYLEPTGPILCLSPNAAYCETQIQMSADDVLAIFTDGLTETGPSRRQLLGVPGIAGILDQACEKQESEALILQHLISNVDEFAGHSMRDDICVLIARVDAPGECERV